MPTNEKSEKTKDAKILITYWRKILKEGSLKGEKLYVVPITNFIEELLIAQDLISREEQRKETEGMREILEAIVDGRAFDKETGVIWAHWLDQIKKILNLTSDAK